MNTEAAIDTHLTSLLGQQLGLRLSARDTTKALDCLRLAAQRAGVSAGTLLNQLEAAPSLNAHPVWPALIEAVTNAESFFFRDEGQMALLSQHLLPELIQRRSASKHLRIWSAGCSHGEEIYSIAMLLLELIPDSHQWRLDLHGSDINPSSLAQARAGVYRDWSFRRPAAHQHSHHLSRQGGQWLLRPELRQRVQFHHFNLAAPRQAQVADWLVGMDLIVCRNVLIYLQRDAIAQVLSTFVDTLAEDGVLMTGHAELMGHPHPALSPELLPGGLIYRKQTSRASAPPMFAPVPQIIRPRTPVAPRAASSPVTVRQPPRAPVAAVSAPTPDAGAKLSAASQQFLDGHYPQAFALAQQAADQTPELRTSALQLMTQCAINLGDLATAQRSVDEALSRDELSVDLHYLAAHVCEFAHTPEQAVRHLETCIYLRSDFVPAYLDLAAMLEGGPRQARVLALRRTALSLLQALAPDTLISPYPDTRAGELSREVQHLLKMTQGAPSTGQTRV